MRAPRLEAQQPVPTPEGHVHTAAHGEAGRHVYACTPAAGAAVPPTAGSDALAGCTMPPPAAAPQSYSRSTVRSHRHYARCRRSGRHSTRSFMRLRRAPSTRARRGRVSTMLEVETVRGRPALGTDCGVDTPRQRAETTADSQLAPHSHQMAPVTTATLTHVYACRQGDPWRCNTRGRSEAVTHKPLMRQPTMTIPSPLIALCS